MKRLSPTLSIALLASAISLSAQTSMKDQFQSFSSYQADWVENGFYFDNVGGLGDSLGVPSAEHEGRALRASRSSGFMVRKTPAFNETWPGATLSIYFQFNGEGTSGYPLSLGITESASNVYGGAANGTDAVDLRASIGRTPTGVRLGLFNDTTPVNISANIELIPGNWYKLELKVGTAANGSFTGVSTALFSSAPDGSNLVQLKNLNNSGTGYTVSSTLAADSEVFIFLGGQNPADRGIDMVDTLEFSLLQ